MLRRIGGVARRRWLPLGLAGLAGLVIAFTLVDRLFLRPPPDGADLGPASFAALGVRSPYGAAVGTLDVEYPRSLRENEDGSILVRYRAAEGWRERFAAAPDLRLEVSIDAARLDIAPAPARHAFDNARIAAAGRDSRRWILSPKAEGDYTLLVRLSAQPAGFTTHHVAANGALLGEEEEVGLPVAVSTRYLVPQLAVDLAKGGVALLSFLLTLPAAAYAIRHLLRRRRPRPVPDAPPAPPADRRDPARRRRKR